MSVLDELVRDLVARSLRDHQVLIGLVDQLSVKTTTPAMLDAWVKGSIPGKDCKMPFGATNEDLDRWFGHVEESRNFGLKGDTEADIANKTARINMVRSAAHELGFMLLSQTPSCPDQTMSLRNLRESVFNAQEAIRLS